MLRDVQADGRAARFRTVICLYLDGRVHYFEGSCEGSISKQKSGCKGFGYDPVFIPKGFDKSVAEMKKEEKEKKRECFFRKS